MTRVVIPAHILLLFARYLRETYAVARIVRQFFCADSSLKRLEALGNHPGPCSEGTGGGSQARAPACV